MVENRMVNNNFIKVMKILLKDIVNIYCCL